MEKEKEKILWLLERVIKDANAKGIKIVVASDEEGNNWNELKPEYMAYGDTKPEYVAIGVFRSVDEDEVFEDIECLHESTHSTSRGVFCADCGIELKN